ncbi:MAG: hypothetical protein ACK53C_14530 [Pseudomonadota bacterium]
MNAADPIGLLAMDCPADEYEAEITRLVPQVVDAKSLEDLVREVHALFAGQFDSQTTGPVDAYEDLARALWQLREGGGVVQRSVGTDHER